MKNKSGLLWGGIFFITLMFVVFGEGEIGYVLGGDTEAYYLNFHHHIGVAPGYPMFIYGLEMLFGRTFYLYVAAVIQMLLLALAVVFLVRTVQEIFELTWWESIIVWGFAMLPFVMLLPEDPIGHTIMTESLTYPLFYIFMAILMKGVTSKKEINFVAALILSMLMAWIRPQMLFTYAVTGIAFFYIQIAKRKKGKADWKNHWMVRTGVMFVGVLLAMKLVSSLTVWYEDYFFDAPALSYSNQTLVQRLLYIADEDDGLLFDDQVMQDIYSLTWERMQEVSTTQVYYDSSWKSWTEIFQAFGANSRILQDVILEVLEERELLETSDPFGTERQVSEISHELTVKLLGKYWPQHLKLTLQLLPKSFISTVAFHKKQIYDLILALTIMVYLYAVGGSCFIYKKNRASAECMMLVVLASCVNAIGCDLVLCGIQRYMAYTLGMMWIGIFLLSRGLVWNKGIFVMWRSK